MKTCSKCGEKHNQVARDCYVCRTGVPSDEVKAANINVVYFHTEKDGTPVYIGEGEVHRPFMYRTTIADRDPKHSRWFFEQLKTRSVTEIVQIKEEFLSKEASKEIEAILIKEYKPRFNK